MIVSSKGRYALRIALALAQNGSDYASLKRIAEQESIPHKYAEAIASALVKAGLAEGARGKSGGYRLTRSPEEITVAQIVQAAETSLSAVSCLQEGNECPRSGSCKTLPMWRALDDNVNEFLSRYTLAQFL